MLSKTYFNVKSTVNYKKKLSFYILLVSDPELIGSVMTETDPDVEEVVTKGNS